MLLADHWFAFSHFSGLLALFCFSLIADQVSSTRYSLITACTNISFSVCKLLLWTSHAPIDFMPVQLSRRRQKVQSSDWLHQFSHANLTQPPPTVHALRHAMASSCLLDSWCRRPSSVPQDYAKPAVQEHWGRDSATGERPEASGSCQRGCSASLESKLQLWQDPAGRDPQLFRGLVLWPDEDQAPAALRGYPSMP